MRERDQPLSISPLKPLQNSSGKACEKKTSVDIGFSRHRCAYRTSQLLNTFAVFLVDSEPGRTRTVWAEFKTIHCSQLCNLWNHKKRGCPVDHNVIAA